MKVIGVLPIFSVVAADIDATYGGILSSDYNMQTRLIYDIRSSIRDARGRMIAELQRLESIIDDVCPSETSIKHRTPMMETGDALDTTTTCTENVRWENYSATRLLRSMNWHVPNTQTHVVNKILEIQKKLAASCTGKTSKMETVEVLHSGFRGVQNGVASAVLATKNVFSSAAETVKGLPGIIAGFLENTPADDTVLETKPSISTDVIHDSALTPTNTELN